MIRDLQVLLADESAPFLGEDLITWLVLALGAAMVAGNVFALLRPPARADQRDGDLERPPVARAAVMVGIGLVAALWALASLLS